MNSEATNRAIKAARIARVLALMGATPTQVRELPPQGRRMAEELAEVNRASDATWAAVIALVERASQLEEA